MSPSSNTRWCPTPEQLMVLDELYRRGLRTPTASQIQKITAHLSLYGKIQGKNVFYWFQNHKARDRQKLRKKLASQLLYSFPHNHFLHFQGSGMCGEAPDGGVMRQYSWRPDPPKDSNLMRTYGHDHSSIVVDAGPSQLHCCNSSSISSKPLQTLELFPLTSPSSTADDQKTPTSSFFINN